MTLPPGGRNCYCAMGAMGRKGDGEVGVGRCPVFVFTSTANAKFEPWVHETQLVPTKAHEPHLKAPVLVTPRPEESPQVPSWALSSNTGSQVPALPPVSPLY